MDRVLLVVLAWVASSVTAQADSVHISGMGFYSAEPTNQDSPPNTNTLYSTPGGTWSFQFDVIAPLASNPVTVTNFSFFSNNVLVSDPLTSVLFSDAEDGGSFSLFLAVARSTFSATRSGGRLAV